MISPNLKNETDIIYDLIVIGSGFGGVMSAYPSVMAGKNVLMLERGDWVERNSNNWGSDGFFTLTKSYSQDAPHLVTAGGEGPTLGTLACVGGASIFFGGVALRLRERDFEPDFEIVGNTGAEWPFAYRDLEPYYSEAEQLLGVSGETGHDPTEPWRSCDYQQKPGPLAKISGRMIEAARSLGHKPFRLPLAINYSTSNQRQACIHCNTCDGFACAVHAKNDMSATIPKLQELGMKLAVNTIAVRLDVEGRKISRVVCVDSQTLEQRSFRGRIIVSAAGAIATPHLLLTSELKKFNPGGDAIGRYLMRHCNSVVMGAFLKRPAPQAEFHKQIGINDYYFGHPTVSEPSGKLGCIQQFGTPQVDYVRRHVPVWKRALVTLGVPYTTGFIVIAEDKPSSENRVSLTQHKTKFGMPQATIVHRYENRDLAARSALIRATKKILKQAGAFYLHVQDILTFSHAIGTVRLGNDPSRSPLDARGAFRGIDNLYVADGSALPRSGGVNPSLTIAANALRVGNGIAANL